MGLIERDLLHGMGRRARVIRITEKCNSNCIFCSVPDDWRKNRKDIGLLEIRQEIMGSDAEIEIGGGEPTIHPDFFQIMDFVSRKEATLTTNARLFSYAPAADRISHMRHLHVKSSLHGPTPEIHDSLTRTRGSFEQAVSGFRNLMKHGIDLGVNIVMVKKNIAYLGETVDLLTHTGVRKIYFSGCMLKGNEAIDRSIDIPYSELRTGLNSVLSRLRVQGIEYYVEKLPVCIAPEHSSAFLAEKELPGFTKVPVCRTCSRNGLCTGINKLHMQRDSRLELMPQ